MEAANLGLTGLLLLLFVGILAGAAGQADWGLLAATAHWDAAPRAVSIVFLSLVRARYRVVRAPWGSHTAACAVPPPDSLCLTGVPRLDSRHLSAAGWRQAGHHARHGCRCALSAGTVRPVHARHAADALYRK